MRGVPAAVLVAAVSIQLCAPGPLAHAQAAPESGAVPTAGPTAGAPTPAQAASRGGPSFAGPTIPDRPYRGQQLIWNPAWGHVGTRDFVLFGAGLSLVIGKYIVGPTFGKRRGGMLIDDDVRDALRLETLEGERFARDLSDITLSISVSYPFFDALVVAGWYRDSPEVAREMAFINAEAMAVTAGLQGLANIIAGRERPFGQRCGNGKPADGRDCDSNDRYYSFFSGHTSQAFAGAGLICIHHAYLPLYGGGFADGGICAAAMLAAAATGTLRIVGDQHYFTDVATGAIVGTLGGVGIPWLLFYRHGGSTRLRGDDDDGLSLQVVPTGRGVLLMGSFQ